MEGDGWRRVALASASSCSTTRRRAEQSMAHSHLHAALPGFRPSSPPRPPIHRVLTATPLSCSSILYQRRWAQRDCARVLWIRADHWYSQTGTKSSLNPAQGSSCTKPPEKKKPGLTSTEHGDRQCRCHLPARHHVALSRCRCVGNEMDAVA